MGRHLQRALILLQQGRHDLAEKELRAELAETPDCPASHSLLSQCLLERNAFDEAQHEAEAAVVSAPDGAFAHRAVARVFLARNRPDEAKDAAEEAIRLDPEQAESFWLLGGIEYERRDWAAALAAADTGLSLEPEHVGCNNLRAMALVKLGRKVEAGQTIDAALARNPDDGLTHANRGWTLLEQRDPTKAIEHFREALRLEPGSEWARMGIVEALKARNPIYGLMLRYFLWMGKLRQSLQWVIVMAVFFGPRLLASLEREFPALAPVATPLRIFLVVFAVMTWIADPLFNLLLRLNRFGRLALSEDQITASNWVGAALLPPIGFFAAWLLGCGDAHLLAALVSGVLVIPVAGGFSIPEGRNRTIMQCATGALATLGGLIVWLMFSGKAEDERVMSQMLPMYFGGIMVSQFLANGLMMIKVKR